MIKNFLFPDNKFNNCTSAALLLLRVVFAGMLMIHGWAKLTDFGATAANFAAFGGTTAAALVIFAEFFCAAGIVAGLLYRLALIPPIIAMAVAFFMAHGARITGEGNGELALLYLVAFVALMITGPGKYALDNMLVRRKE